MLQLLRVRNLAIIDQLELDLEPGLNVVTGETGAGKSILVDALELVLGARVGPELVRTGAKQAEVEGLFDVSGDERVRARLVDAGLTEEGEAVVRRVVGARSRAFVNGRLATLTQLRELARGLADISSQHEHHSLIDARRHLEYLDAFASLDDLRTRVGRAHEALLEADRVYRDELASDSSRAEREDLLRYQIGEIDAFGPDPSEAEQLQAERNRLRHAERLARASGGTEAALYSEDDAVCAVLDRIGQELSGAADLDPTLEPLVAQIEGARAQLEDAARELGRYGQMVSLDPDRLAEVDDRLDLLKRLARKYGGSVEQMIAHRDAAQAELDAIDRRDERLAALESARDKALDEARTLATELSKARRAAAASLGRAISDQLASLGMGDAEVRVEVAPLEGGRDLDVDGARLTATGIDRVEFLISPNRGEDARPLAKIASGGELSRSLLAIKRVLAGLRPTGLYVFDEVDSGVGGAVAEVIGHKLRDVALHHQVLCITHLPQIAVFADAHFRVTKEVVDGRTCSRVERLGTRERLEEIARMLGGVKVTKKTRDAAAEMLKGATV